MRRASVVSRRFLGSFRAGHPRGGAVLLAGVLIIVIGGVTAAAAQTPAPAVLRYSRGTSAVVLDRGFQPSFELGGTHLGAGLRVGF